MDMRDDATEAGRVAQAHVHAYVQQLQQQDARALRLWVGGWLLVAVGVVLMFRAWLRA